MEGERASRSAQRAAERRSTAFGWRVYGLAVMALGVAGLVCRDFILGPSVPKDFPARTALVPAAGLFLVLAGAALEWRRTAAWAAAGLAAYYTVLVLILMDGRFLLTHYAQFGAYSSAAEQLAVAAGALIVYATSAQGGKAMRIDRARAERLKRFGQRGLGLCALLFGGAHFVYMNLTAPLIPRWLPPTQVFWAYATGIGFIAAGVALITGVRARLAAILLSAMLASFTLLVHVPLLLAQPTSRDNWTELAVNVAVLSAAWVVADSLAPSASED